MGQSASAWCHQEYITEAGAKFRCVGLGPNTPGRVNSFPITLNYWKWLQSVSSVQAMRASRKTFSAADFLFPENFLPKFKSKAFFPHKIFLYVLPWGAGYVVFRLIFKWNYLADVWISATPWSGNIRRQGGHHKHEGMAVRNSVTSFWENQELTETLWFYHGFSSDSSRGVMSLPTIVSDYLKVMSSHHQSAGEHMKTISWNST